MYLTVTLGSGACNLDFGYHIPMVPICARYVRFSVLCIGQIIKEKQSTGKAVTDMVRSSFSFSGNLITVSIS